MVYCGCISFLPPVQLGGVFETNCNKGVETHCIFGGQNQEKQEQQKTDKITIGKTYFPINQVGVLTSLTAKNPGDQKYPGCTS